MFTKKIRQFSLLLIVAMLVAVVTSQVALGATTAQGGWYPTAMPTKNWNKPAATPTKSWNSWQPTPTKSWNKPAATPTKNWSKPAATPTKNWNSWQPTPTPTRPTTLPTTINKFDAYVETLPNKTSIIHVEWDVSGATSISLILSEANSNNQIFILDEKAKGSRAINLGDYIGNNNLFRSELSLIAQSESRTIMLQFPCDNSYSFNFVSFFPDEAENCPVSQPVVVNASYQQFEHGMMIWVENPAVYATGREIAGRHIVVLHIRNDYGRIAYPYDGYDPYDGYEDSWTPNQPISDPSLVPPSNLYQPMYGFGKLWRENAAVRDALGWATAPEQSYRLTYQVPRTISTYYYNDNVYWTLPDTKQLLWFHLGYSHSGIGSETYWKVIKSK